MVGVTVDLPEEGISATTRGSDYQTHGNEKEIVVPAVARLAPESRVPHEDLLLNGTKHDENEPQCGELREHTKRYTQSAGHLGQAEKPGKARALADAFTAGNRILGVAISAPDEDPPHQQPHEEQSHIGEPIQLRDLHASDLFLLPAAPQARRSVQGHRRRRRARHTEVASELRTGLLPDERVYQVGRRLDVG